MTPGLRPVDGVYRQAQPGERARVGKFYISAFQDWKFLATCLITMVKFFKHRFCLP